MTALAARRRHPMASAVLLLLGLVVAGLAYAAAAPGQTARAATGATQDVAAGKQLFLANCSTCHGVTLSIRNLYGAQLETAGIASDIQAAFDATDDLNADGDAALNWVEMVNGTWPADPNDFVPVGATTWGKIKKLFHD